MSSKDQDSESIQASGGHANHIPIITSPFDHLSTASLQAVQIALQTLAHNILPKLSNHDRKDASHVLAGLLTSCEGDLNFLTTVANVIQNHADLVVADEAESPPQDNTIAAAPEPEKQLVMAPARATECPSLDELDATADPVEKRLHPESQLSDDVEGDIDDDAEVAADVEVRTDAEAAGDTEVETHADAEAQHSAREGTHPPRKSLRKTTGGAMISTLQMGSNKAGGTKRKKPLAIVEDEPSRQDSEHPEPRHKKSRTDKSANSDGYPSPPLLEAPLKEAIKPPPPALGHNFGNQSYEDAYNLVQDLAKEKLWDCKRASAVRKVVFEDVLSPAVSNLIANVVRYATPPATGAYPSRADHLAQYDKLVQDPSAPPSIRKFAFWQSYYTTIEDIRRWGCISRHAADYMSYEIYIKLIELIDSGDDELVQWLATFDATKGPRQVLEAVLSFMPWQQKRSARHAKSRAKLIYTYVKALGGPAALLLLDKNGSLTRTLGTSVTLTNVEDIVRKIGPYLCQLHPLVAILDQHVWQPLAGVQFVGFDHVDLTPLIKALKDAEWTMIAAELEDSISKQGHKLEASSFQPRGITEGRSIRAKDGQELNRFSETANEAYEEDGIIEKFGSLGVEEPNTEQAEAQVALHHKGEATEMEYERNERIHAFNMRLNDSL